MDQEIDLRPYLQAIMRGWRLIVGLVAVFCALAAVTTLLLPRAAQARGDILVIPKASQLSLDPRFAERDSTMLTNSVNQRQALIDLATSSVLEARVAEQLGLSSYHAGELVWAISVRASSDLIQVSATGATPADALRLAETWTRSYEALVNELYSGAGPELQQLDAQLADAQGRFDEAQTALVTLYATGDLVRAEQQVQRLEGLLEGGVEAQVSLYTQYLTHTQELNLILEDARALQAQYEASRGPDLSASLAALAVRARLAGADQLPVQLNFDSAESFAQGQAAAANLERFVTVLEGERDRMVAQADALARDLAAGNAAAVGLPTAVRAGYEEKLASARGALARAEGQETLLNQRRKIALSSLEVLQAKRDESQIAQAVPEISVRYVGVATVPPRSLAASMAINLTAAVIVGLTLALTWVIGRELASRLAPAASGGAPASSQGERPADRPVASD